MSDELTFEQKVERFRQSVASEEDRNAYAESWAELILVKLPAEATVRNIYTIERLPAGASPVYTLDFDYVNAWVLPKMGSHPINLLQTEEVTIPTFEVAGHVSYKLQLARDGRFQVADQARRRLKDSIVDLEETQGWTVLKAAVTAGNTFDLTATEDGLSLGVINQGFKVMEARRGYKITDIYASPNKVADIRTWTVTTISDEVQTRVFDNKGLGSIWGANIHTVYGLDDDEVYFIDGREGLLGYMPIREDLKTFDDPTAIKSFRVGIIAYEHIGFGVLDPDRIVKAVVD